MTIKGATPIRTDHGETLVCTHLLITSGGGTGRDVVSLLERRGIRVTERPYETGADRFAAYMRQDLILIEQSERNSGNWQTLARDMVRAQGSAPVILLAEGGSEELAVAAMRLGVRDYLPLPVSAPALNEALERCLGQTKHGRGTGEARQAPRNDNNDRDDAMVGESEVRWT